MSVIVRRVLTTPAVVVNGATLFQTIDHIGGADVFNSAPLSDADADLFFDQTLGIGLSGLRTGIDWSGVTLGAYSNAAKAAARGAIVWAAPWSAPAADKDNGTIENGGHLLPGSYDSWATRLAAFQGLLELNAGSTVELYALSVQNEPDFSAPYDSMLYTNTEMVNFIKILGPKLAALSPRPKLVMPEVAAAANQSGYVAAVIADGTALGYLDIVAWHQYAGVTGPSTALRPIWQTEMSSFDGFDPSMANALTVAGWLYDAFTTGNVCAWDYWWLQGLNSDNEGLRGHDGGVQTTKRLYALGNYSKFVRPGMVRVGTSGSVAGVSFLAFKNTSTGACAIVVINTNAAITPFLVSLQGLIATSLVPWVTSAAHDLVRQATIPTPGGMLVTELLPSSVTTFVGTGS